MTTARPTREMRSAVLLGLRTGFVSQVTVRDADNHGMNMTHQQKNRSMARLVVDSDVLGPVAGEPRDAGGHGPVPPLPEGRVHRRPERDRHVHVPARLGPREGLAGQPGGQGTRAELPRGAGALRRDVARRRAAALGRCDRRDRRRAVRHRWQGPLGGDPGAAAAGALAHRDAVAPLAPHHRPARGHGVPRRDASRHARRAQRRDRRASRLVARPSSRA